MKERFSLFSYKNGSSFLHKCPSWCKLLFIPVISLCVLFLPFYFSMALVLIQFLIACFLRFSIKEQFCDIRPILYYAFLLYFVKLISISFTALSAYFGWGTEFASDAETLSWKWFFSQFSWALEKENIFMLTKILCLMQSTSLLFKTSTSLQIREGLEKIELRIRQVFSKHTNSSSNLNSDKTVNSAPIATALSLFINFIPMVDRIWSESKKAWFARRGKKGLKMYSTLLPVLFSVGMKKAWNTARAIQIRAGK